jgi:hypothetical protein
MSVAGNGSGVYALDTETGEQQWNFENGRGHASPVVADSTVIVQGDRQGERNNSLGYSAIDIESGTLNWEFGDIETIYPLTATANNTFYAATGPNLLAIDAETGEKQWETRYREQPDKEIENLDVYFNSSPTIVGNLVWIAGANSTLYAFNTENGEEMLSLEIAGLNVSKPTKYNGFLFVTSQQDETGLSILHALRTPATPALNTDTGNDASGGTSGFVTRFEEFTGSSGFLPSLIGIGGVAALGIGAYRRFGDSDTDSDDDRTTPQTESISSAEPTAGLSPPDLNGTTYDDYEMEGQIGSTSHIEVSEAVEPSNETAVALYNATSDSGETIDTTILDQLVDGFDTWNDIDDHEHILTVYEHGETPTPWAAVELADRRFDPLEFDDASLETKRDLVAGLCAAVHNGHRYGLTHGDLQNGTYIVDDEEIQKIRVGDWEITDAAIGDDPDQQSDIDEVVEMAFALFTGELAFEIDHESVTYPAGLKAVFEPWFADKKSYETVIHFSDAVSESI